MIGNIIGGLLSSGDKPKVPKFHAIDTAKEQQGAIKGNIAAFGDASALASNVNLFNQEQLTKMIEAALPGGSQQIKENIMSQLRGEIPEDVAKQISRNTAEQSIAGGFAGSQFARNLTSRDLGLTSLQLTQQGMDAASRWIKASTAPMMDISSMFITPQQRIQTEMFNRENQWNTQWLKNRVSAMPDPKLAAVGQGLIKFEDQLMSIAGSVAGSAAGAAV